MPEQGRRLLEHSTPLTPRALRDHAMVAMLIGCGLRRAELLALTLESVQQREEHWVIADLVGKGVSKGNLGQIGTLRVRIGSHSVMRVSSTPPTYGKRTRTSSTPSPTELRTSPCAHWWQLLEHGAMSGGRSLSAIEGTRAV